MGTVQFHPPGYDRIPRSHVNRRLLIPKLAQSTKTILVHELTEQGDRGRMRARSGAVKIGSEDAHQEDQLQ